MRSEYDFSNGERGKFFRKGVELNELVKALITAAK